MKFTFTEMPFESYRNLDAINFSSLKKCEISVKHMHHALDKKVGSEQTKSMHKGNLIHKAILEPYSFESDVIACDLNRNTKLFKEFFSENSSKIIVKSSELEMIKQIRENVFNNQLALEMIENTMHEVSVMRDSEFGRIKCRFDCLSDSIKLDVKTTASISDRAYSAGKYGYHIQMGWYDEVLNSVDHEKNDWHVLWIESHEPYDVCIDVVDRECVDMGRMQAKIWARRYSEARGKGVFEGVGNGSLLYVNERFFPNEDELLEI